MIQIDPQTGVIRVEEAGNTRELNWSTPEGFHLISKLWLRSGWDNKYVYGFSWLGRPIIQLPDDMIRIQEVVYAVQPDVIVETGVAHGGSLIFYASVCHAIGHGRVIGIDVEIRPHNRAALDAHRFRPSITLIEGSSIDPGTVAEVRSKIQPGEKVLVLLDSCHTKAHVLAELEAYGPLVSPGSYIVAMDGIMGEVVGAPRTQPDWTWNNPTEAAREFLTNRPEFQLVEPPFPFNEGQIRERVTYWPGAFLKRVA